MKKITHRLDVLVHMRGLAPSREQARRLVMAGEVRVDGQVQFKPATKVDEQVHLSIDEKPPYVSRGGLKLAAALDTFNISPDGWVCADVGASTGGFTDVLLQHGARKVYAIDVGYGQLAWGLRQDERVISMERVNVRYLESLPEPVSLVVMDVSFISAGLLLPVISRWLDDAGQIVLLVKPQFEAGREQVGKGGIVRDPATHCAVLRTVIDESEQAGLFPLGLIPSPITGAKGNIEFLLWLASATHDQSLDMERTIEDVVTAAHQSVGDT